jgi:hypothetical protein
VWQFQESPQQRGMCQRTAHIRGETARTDGLNSPGCRRILLCEHRSDPLGAFAELAGTCQAPTNFSIYRTPRILPAGLRHSATRGISLTVLIS